MYGKLVDEKIVYASKNLTEDGATYVNPTEEIYNRLGWKNVVYADMPTDIRYKYESKWFETGNELIQEWIQVDLTEEEKEERYSSLAVQYIREKYSQDDEYKVLREYLANGEFYRDKFDEYNAYVESCKVKANREVYGDG